MGGNFPLNYSYLTPLGINFRYIVWGQDFWNTKASHVTNNTETFFFNLALILYN